MAGVAGESDYAGAVVVYEVGVKYEVEIRMKAISFLPLVLVCGLMIPSGPEACRAQDFHPPTVKHYETPVDSLIQPLFPLVKVSGCEAGVQPVKVGDVQINVEKDIFISSIPGVKARWSTALDYSPGFGCVIYKGDLDNDGVEDLVVVTFGGDSSGGYNSRLTIFLIDGSGMPNPWRVEGYFRTETQGVREIARGQDGRALILDSITAGHPAWGGVSYGYRLFRPRDGQMEEVSGILLGVTWPYLPKTNPDNEELAWKIATSTSITSGTTRAVPSAATVNQRRLNLVDGTPLPIPEITVVDHADHSRTIFFDPTDKELARLAGQRYSIQITGTTNRFEPGGPFLLWAKAVAH